MRELVFTRHGTELFSFKMESASVVLGRGEKCDVVLPDERVSRQHVRLSVSEGVIDGKVFVEDLSGRGLVIAGAKVTARTELEQGAEFELGQWTAAWREATGDGGVDSQGHETIKGRAETARAPADSPSTGVQAGNAQVRIRHGGKEGSFLLADKPVTFGKDAGNDVVLDDAFVSGKHVRIVPNVPSAGLFHIADLHSTNGTYLGPSRVYEADVPFFTTLRVGGTELVIEPLSGSAGARTSTNIVGQSPAIKQLLEVISRIAPSTASVAILGESGTGKELVARALHENSSRADKPFIPVNCAAITKSLIESELFGHEKGAFTGALNARKGAFEEADGGTLFLDEIGELSPELQATLLRALESGEVKRVGATRPTHVDVRLVAATNVDLLTAVREKRFREDLYYRICVIPVHVPPLRARKADIPALVEHFLKVFSPRGFGVRFTAAALGRLDSHDWNGNVRELRNVVQRGVLLRKSGSVDEGDILFDEQPGQKPVAAGHALRSGMNLAQTMAAIEREIVEDCLRRHGGRRDFAAKELGLARAAFFKRLNEWGLTGSDDAE